VLEVVGLFELLDLSTHHVLQRISTKMEMQQMIERLLAGQAKADIDQD
jgi:hypothetical protein